MSEYLVVFRQHGGCDYTIGCGIAVQHVSADDLQGACAQVTEQLCDLEGTSDETASSIVEVDIYERSAGFSKLDPASWRAARASKRAEAEKAQREDKERAEYERLRKKFER